MGAIKIIDVPRGEAPPWVRQAWIGLSLPLLAPGKRRSWGTAGVLTGPKTPLATAWRRLLIRWGLHKGYAIGYAVDPTTAVAILAGSRPEAAQWWRTNTPHLLRPDRVFLFNVEACQEIEDIIWPPPPSDPLS